MTLLTTQLSITVVILIMLLIILLPRFTSLRNITVIMFIILLLPLRPVMIPTCSTYVCNCLLYHHI